MVTTYGMKLLYLIYQLRGEHVIPPTARANYAGDVVTNIQASAAIENLIILIIGALGILFYDHL